MFAPVTTSAPEMPLPLEELSLLRVMISISTVDMGFRFGFVISRSPVIQLFHWDTAANSHIVASTAFESGRQIITKRCSSFAPSIFSDSSSSGGRLLKKVRMTMMV